MSVLWSINAAGKKLFPCRSKKFPFWVLKVLHVTMLHSHGISKERRVLTKLCIAGENSSDWWEIFEPHNTQ